MIWNNIKTTPQRWAAYWLRRHGWVVFYLDECARNCAPTNQGCWLQIYQESERKR